MIYCLLGVLAILITIFSARIQGYLGAILLGISTLGMDFIWQWLRAKLMQHKKTSILILGIFGGMLVRIFSVLAFLQIGKTWLDPKHFYWLVIIVLTIPIWSIVSAHRLKNERN